MKRQTAPTVRKFDDLTSLVSEWEAYVRGHPRATFFHLMGWQRVLAGTFHYRPVRLVALRDGRLCGVLPLFSVKSLPFGRSLISTPLGVYGGICADDEEAEAALLSAARAHGEAARVRYVELRNIEPLDGLPVKDLYVTFRKEIDQDPDKNLAAIPRKQRRMVRQGDKHDLAARLGGEELLPAFYEIYSISVRNLGTPVYPRRLFLNLLREFGPDCRILGVFRQERMLAGVMTFFFKDQVMPYYGGALKEAFRYAVNDFMYWKLMCHGAEQGYRLYDFGRSKKDTGSYRFKCHWGFEPQPLAYQYHLVRQEKLPDLSPRNPRFSLAIELWKKMPLRLTQVLGPGLVRYFP